MFLKLIAHKQRCSKNLLPQYIPSLPTHRNQVFSGCLELRASRSDTHAPGLLLGPRHRQTVNDQYIEFARETVQIFPFKLNQNT